MHKISFNTKPLDGGSTTDSDGAKAKLTCPMPVQKETPTGMIDTVCNGDTADHQAGLCRWVYFNRIFLPKIKQIGFGEKKFKYIKK